MNNLQYLYKWHVKYVAEFLIIILVTLFVSKYCFQLALVQGDSMSPSYRNLQPIIIYKLKADITYGDVIAFRSDNLNALLIKRVVAIPGDNVEISKGILYVNDVPAIDTQETSISFAGIASNQIRLKEDEYFVLGDNYQHSIDSRYEEVGCVLGEDIIGKVYP